MATLAARNSERLPVRGGALVRTTMIAPLDQIKEALRAERDKPEDFDGCHEFVIQHQPPEPGREVPVQPAVGKRAKCRARIIDHWPCAHGGHVVRVELLPPVVAPRLLRPSRAGEDYTSSPRFALASGHEPEPEAVPKEWEETYGLHAAQGNVLRNAELRKRWEEESIVQRLENEILEAERLGVDSTRFMARLEAGLNALKRENALAKQQRRKAA